MVLKTHFYPISKGPPPRAVGRPRLARKEVSLKGGRARVPSLEGRRVRPRPSGPPAKVSPEAEPTMPPAKVSMVGTCCHRQCVPGRGVGVYPRGRGVYPSPTTLSAAQRAS